MLDSGAIDTSALGVVTICGGSFTLAGALTPTVTEAVVAGQTPLVAVTINVSASVCTVAIGSDMSVLLRYGDAVHAYVTP